MSISQKSHFGLPTANFRPFFFPGFGLIQYTPSLLLEVAFDGAGVVWLDAHARLILSNSASAD
jgi:hypothetical protein